MSRQLLFILAALLLTSSAYAQKALGTRLQSYDYPYPVYFMPATVESRHVQIAYMDVRPSRPNGKVVLLMHGKNFPAAYWQHTIVALTGAGYRVLAPDALGFGKSSKPLVQYSFSLLAALTRELLNTLKIQKVAVIGHSMGGMLATRFALSYPERVSKLVLEDALGLEDWRSKGVPYRKVDDWYKDEQAATFQSIQKYHKTSYYPVWKEEYNEWINVQYGMKLSKDRKQLDYVNALTYDMIFNQPVVHEFPDLKVPTLVVIGTEDKTKLARGVSERLAATFGNYRKLGKEAANAIPNSRLIEYENIGHVPHLEIPEQFHADLIEFLK